MKTIINKTPILVALLALQLAGVSYAFELPIISVFGAYCMGLPTGSIDRAQVNLGPIFGGCSGIVFTPKGQIKKVVRESVKAEIVPPEPVVLDSVEDK